MKLSYFVIISIGLMFTFYLAGIDTGSSKILSVFTPTNTTFNNQTVETNPTVSVGSITGFDSLKNLFFNQTMFVLVFAAIISIVVLSFINVQALTFSWNPNPDAAFAVFALAIWALMAIDLYSVITYMRTISGGTGYMFNITFIIMLLYLVGFMFSLFKFIKTGE